MSRQISNFCIVVGAILIAFVGSLLVVSAALFAVGIALAWFQIPLAAFIAAGFGWWAARHYFSERPGYFFGLAFGTAVLAFLLFARINAALYDISWDGQTYHAEAIVQLANGWNPFHDAVPTGLIFPTYLSFFAKGPWICAAALYKFSGNFESGKAFHLTLILASWLLALAALSTFHGLKWPWIVILSLLLAFNPVSICQMFTYYVDGQLASLLTMTISLLILIYRRPDRVLMLVLVLVLIVTINIKLNGAIYEAIIGGGYWLWYVLSRKVYRIELAAWFLVAGIVGSVFVGFNPYITQYAHELIATGNPFYPTDLKSLIVLEANLPTNFDSLNQWQKLVVDLFSRSDSSSRPATFKIPLTFSRREIRVFGTPDVRVGGFGPFFGGALLLTATLVVLLIWKARWRLAQMATVLILIGLIGVSAFSNSELWWARYAPQIWMIPILMAGVGLLIVRNIRWRWLIYTLVVVLCINNVLIYRQYVIYTLDGSMWVTRQLAGLKQGITPPHNPIPIQLNRFVGIRYRLEGAGIPFVEVAILPCENDKRTPIIASQAFVCNP